jgi:arylsulfatase A-like enzyme
MNLSKVSFGLYSKILILLPAIVACSGRQQKPPNLLIVFPDQMRGQALGFLSMEPAITPVIDAFARESLVLTSAVSNYPVSSPFRAMFLTGKYPISNCVVSNCTSETGPFNVKLQKSDTTWSDMLKNEGYSLGYIGKWHLESPYKPYVDCSNNKSEPAWNEWTPPDRRHGFSYWHAYNTYDQHNRPMYWDTDSKRDGFFYVDQWGPEHEAEMAARYINNQGGKFRDPDKPWALVVSMNPPHMPYDLVPEKYVSMYDTVPDEKLFSFPDIPSPDSKWGKYNRKNARNQYAQITGVDDNFGKILKALHDAGMDQNTIVLFTSDHGDCLGRHDEISKNNCYEESMVIPFIIRWPGHFKPGKDDLLISVPDVYPTLLSLLGLGSKVPKGVMGKDYSDIFLTGKGSRPSSQLYMWMPFDNPTLGKRGVRTNNYTLMFNRLPDNTLDTVLFDNIKDPYQMNNIASKNLEIVTSLTNELQKWLTSNHDTWGKN